jgi:hypothetical protein
MRRRKLLVALAGLAVVAAGAVVMWPRSSSRITREDSDRIKEGMSRAEVETILGPPGDYRTGIGETDYGRTENTWIADRGPDFALSTNWVPGQSKGKPYLRADWMDDSFRITIVIGQSGSVVVKEGWPRRKTQGQLDDLLWRFKRQWHRWFP